MNIHYRAPVIYCKLFFFIFDIWCYIQHS